jgi:hypothetical protein
MENAEKFGLNPPSVDEFFWIATNLLADPNWSPDLPGRPLNHTDYEKSGKPNCLF